MSVLIDIHQHILVGMDDGPQDQASMERMLTAAWRQGVRTLVATPHLSPGIIPFCRETLERRVWETQQAAVALGLDLQIAGGAELLYTVQAERYLAQGSIPTLGGTDKILVEFSPAIRYEQLCDAVRVLLRNGYIPILAHVERYPCLMGFPRRMNDLKTRWDVLCQMNAGTLVGRAAYLRKLTLRRLLTEGLIDFIASDAHDDDRRPCRMQEAYDSLLPLVGRDGADELTGNHDTLEDFLGR